MKKKPGVKRVCALLLGTAIVLGGLPADMVQAETESDKSQEKSVIKRTEFQLEDDFEDGLDEAWFDQQGAVSCEEGVLKLTSDNNVSSIKRNVGNGDFSAEFQLGGYSADTSGNHSVVIFRVSDGSENNLAEIQRFSNGELKLLVINEGKQTSYTTVTDYQDPESWFRIGYNSEEKTLTAEYKASGEADFSDRNWRRRRRPKRRSGRWITSRSERNGTMPGTISRASRCLSGCRVSRLSDLRSRWKFRLRISVPGRSIMNPCFSSVRPSPVRSGRCWKRRSDNNKSGNEKNGTEEGKSSVPLLR